MREVVLVDTFGREVRGEWRCPGEGDSLVMEIPWAGNTFGRKYHMGREIPWRRRCSGRQIAWKGNSLWSEIFWEGYTVRREVPWEDDTLGKEMV